MSVEIKSTDSVVYFELRDGQLLAHVRFDDHVKTVAMTGVIELALFMLLVNPDVMGFHESIVHMDEKTTDKEIVEMVRRLIATSSSVRPGNEETIH